MPAPARFAIGTGIGFGGVGDVGPPSVLSGLAGNPSASASAAQRTPFGVALAEVTVTRVWRVVLGAAGSYNRQLSRDDIGNNKPVGLPKHGDRSWSAGGSVGVRAVLNPGGVVEVSPLLTVGVYKGETKGIPVSSRLDSDSGNMLWTTAQAIAWSYDARLGLVLEHALLPQLFLRFETYFLRVGYGKYRYTTDTPSAPDTRTERSDFSVSYGLSPSLLLRMTF